jgi:hypothetical protein
MGEKSFFQILKELFGAKEFSKEDQALYAEGVRRGIILVLVKEVFCESSFEICETAEEPVVSK